MGVFAADFAGAQTTAEASAAGSSQLHYPRAVAVDSSQNIYVANEGSIGGMLDSVTVYPPNIPMTSPGTTGPSEVLQGSNTQLQGPTGIAVDSAGYIYTAGISSGTLNYVINMYAPLAAGTNNAAPVATIPLGMNVFVPGLALDASGRIYISNYNQNSVTLYPARVGTTLSSTPLATIVGAATLMNSPSGVAIDSSGKIYVSNEFGGTPGGFINVYAANPSGGVNAAPLAQVFSATLGRISSVAVDTSGEIYVADPDIPAVDEFAANPSGAVTEAPVGTISGTVCGLQLPEGVAAH